MFNHKNKNGLASLTLGISLRAIYAQILRRLTSASFVRDCRFFVVFSPSAVFLTLSYEPKYCLNLLKNDRL